MRLPAWLAQHLAALRAVAVFTIVLGLAYPLFMVAVAQIPGLSGNADGSLVSKDGKTVGSSIIGQSFTDADGNPLKQYFQSRPSAAGDGYDPTATSASNLGPESVVDTLPDPSVQDDEGKQSLLTQVCQRSKAIGELEGVDGSRPYCTAGGVGAVLAVFHQNGSTGPVTRAVSLNEACPATPFIQSYQGVTVECAKPGEDYAMGVVTPIRGTAPDKPAIPADAVTASGSGLDPHISVAYARLQVNRVAGARNMSAADVQKLVDEHTTGRALGFMGEPAVNVLELNLALDRAA
ncbi:potassium-transporting ATPase subunit C [Dactylosporangium sp. AC04546]|uniref:potassium-transporting ATPase subunit C n=1 Tax=Dactylosporangium sp. AC04546 TaxID=2862460 RepID=UPI002E7AEB8C|nr:potassium-transporting ATPase subunit C [Dactylosporangium sp. AC04546]WVK78828.1 potassium-transporting ATPase subunit C [Dactylosporangium sp. AC04546]